MNEINICHELSKNQIAELEELREKCAAQAAVIEKLRCILEQLACLGNGGKHGNSIGNTIAKDALAIPTDSKQILAEWLDKQLGEPFLYQYEYVFNINSDSQGLPYEECTVTKFSATLPKGGVDIIHLFKKPGIK